jgi:PAS domain S-box-containing protein
MEPNLTKTMRADEGAPALPEVVAPQLPSATLSAGDALTEQALALYRAIFVKSTEPIAIIDPGGHYIEQNDAHRRLLGYSDEELRGRTPAIHLGEAGFASIAMELTTTGVSRRECISRTRDGRDLNVELSSFAVRDAAGHPVCYVGTKRDVTEQRRAAAEARQKFDELQAIYRMADAVSRAGELEEIYGLALDQLVQTVHADRASVLLFDPDGVMRFKAWRGLSDEYRKAVEGHTPWSPEERNAQPIFVPDVESDPELAPYLPVFQRESLRALGFIPLTDAGRLLGKFMIYFNHPHQIGDSQLQLAQTIASHIAFAISRKRAEAELRENVKAQQLLAEAGALLNSSLDYEETLRSITELAVPAIADWCLVDLTDERGGYHRIAAAAAYDEDKASAQGALRYYPPREDTGYGVAHVALTGEAQLVPNVGDAIVASIARDRVHLELLRSAGISSYMCAPLVTRGRTIGALTFAVSRSGRAYSTGELALAEELARRTAMAVDNARLYREAQEANLAKSQFLATMSHELRTPLNAISGYAELLELELHGPLTSDQREDIARIQRSQRHLLGLINDLLSFARIETGHLELRVEHVSLEEALRVAESLFTPQISAKNLSYERELVVDTLLCLADRAKLGQILLNLLSNAVKFTPEGGDLTVTCELRDGGVAVHVRDSGPGIPLQKLEAIFQPFVQLHAPLTRVTEGTGLGLAISRELARAMGGDVTVSSEVGSGSTFTLTLPAA